MRDIRATDKAQYFRPILNVDYLQSELRTYPDRDFANHIVTAAKHGVKLGYSGPRYFRECANWPSTLRHGFAVQKIIDKDLARGRKLVFLSPPSATWMGSPMGAFEKKSSPGKFRVVFDLSWPPRRSVNDFITDDVSLSYISVDSAISYVKKYGVGTLLAKLDIEDAFKHILVAPEDWELLGSTWLRKLDDGTFRKEYYIDLVLPFGGRSSPKLFNEFADALQFIMQRNGVTDCCHFLDDYLTAGPPNSDVCKQNLNTMVRCCEQTGFSVQRTKLVEPTTVIEFLGIIVDTVKQEVRISAERMSNIIAELRLYKDRKMCKKRQLLSIIGKLSFICQVVRPGRTFIRRLIDLSKRTRHLHHHVKLHAEARKDIQWWLDYLPSWNGVYIFYDDQWSSNMCLHLYTDASDVGYGAVFDKRWIMCRFQGKHARLARKNIAWRELYALVVAAATWGHLLKGRRVLMHCDNMAVTCVLKSGTSKDKDMSELIRKLFYVSAMHNFEVSAVHISGRKNSAADSLSRQDLQKFRTLVPWAYEQPSVPHSLSDLIL